jgi:hypothetical protein
MEKYEKVKKFLRALRKTPPKEPVETLLIDF